MKKSKLIKNLISVGVAVALVAVIAFYTKPKLPAPENLTAAVLMTTNGQKEIQLTFSPKLESDETFPTDYSVLFKLKEGKTIQLVFSTTRNQLLIAKYQGRKLNKPNELFKDFRVSFADGQVLVRGTVPNFLSYILESPLSVSANAVEVMGSNIRNIGAAATATVKIDAGGIEGNIRAK